MKSIELRHAEPDDREYVAELLAENDLPTADLDEALPSLFVCESADGVVGVGGLEVEGRIGLLRSLAVEAPVRGQGYGTAICDRLLERARDEDLDAVYLLTTTAEDFFAGRGFEEVEREEVPEPIRGTAEFSDLCPASATCMKLELS